MGHGAGLAISLVLLAFSPVSGGTGQDGDDYFPQSLRDATMRCGLWGRSASREVMSDFVASWYGGHLRAAGEPPLFGTSGPTLRFTWLRTFHAPVVVRLDTAADGTVSMTATELSGQGGYEPGTVARRVERRLDAQEVAALKRVVEDTGVLKLAPGECRLGLDGAEWIVESAGPDGYRFVGRWAPDEGPVRELGLLMLGFTGWALEPVY